MKRLLDILNLPLTTLIKEEYKNIKNSKHSPVYRKRDVEGFASLFCFFSVNLGKANRRMKLALQYICLVLGMTFFTIQSHAQIKGIIGTANFDEDNAIMGDTTNITIVAKFVSSVTNNDTSVTGDVFFRYKTNWSIDWWYDWNASFDDSVIVPQVIPYGFSIYEAKMPIPIDSNVFRTGPVNVIIIWPAFHAPGIAYEDSADYVLSNQSAYMGLVEEPIEKFGSTVFPNPSEGFQLVVLNAKYAKEIEEVVIYNSVGQVVATKKFSEGGNGGGHLLPTDGLNAGVYNIHITYKDRKREVVKFIKN